MFGTCLAGQVTGHQLVPVRGHHQFHSDGHLVVCLPPFHPGGNQFPNQLGAHGIIIISLHVYDNNIILRHGRRQTKNTQIYRFRTMYLKVPIKIVPLRPFNFGLDECQLSPIIS